MNLFFQKNTKKLIFKGVSLSSGSPDPMQELADNIIPVYGGIVDDYIVKKPTEEFVKLQSERNLGSSYLDDYEALVLLKKPTLFFPEIADSNTDIEIGVVFDLVEGYQPGYVRFSMVNVPGSERNVEVINGRASCVYQFADVGTYEILVENDVYGYNVGRVSVI